MNLNTRNQPIQKSNNTYDYQANDSHNKVVLSQILCQAAHSLKIPILCLIFLSISLDTYAQIPANKRGTRIERLRGADGNDFVPVTGLDSLLHYQAAKTYWRDSLGFAMTDSLLGDQLLSRSGDTIFLERGGYVVLPSGVVVTDDQIISLSNDTLYIEDGGFVIIPTFDDSELRDSLAVHRIDIDAFVDHVDDADSDPTNELQNWSNLPGIPADIADGDDVGITTETDPTVEGHIKSITTTDISNWDTDNVDDADNDPTNELQSWSNLPGIPADIADGDDVGITTETDPTVGSHIKAISTTDITNWDTDDVDDADADPTNELQNWSNLPGIPSGFSDNIDDVDDGDNDPTNELYNDTVLQDSLAIHRAEIDSLKRIDHQPYVSEYGVIGKELLQTAPKGFYFMSNTGSVPLGNILNIKEQLEEQNVTTRTGTYLGYGSTSFQNLDGISMGHWGLYRYYRIDNDGGTLKVSGLVRLGNCAIPSTVIFSQNQTFMGEEDVFIELQFYQENGDEIIADDTLTYSTTAAHQYAAWNNTGGANYTATNSGNISGDWIPINYTVQAPQNTVYIKVIWYATDGNNLVKSLGTKTVNAGVIMTDFGVSYTAGLHETESLPQAVELQSWSTLPGIPSGFADGIDNTGILTEVDGSITNELQSWSTLPGIPADIADGDDVGITTESDPTVGSHIKGITTTDISNWDDDQDDQNLTWTQTSTANKIGIEGGNDINIFNRVQNWDVADVDERLFIPHGGVPHAGPPSGTYSSGFNIPGTSSGRSMQIAGNNIGLWYRSKNNSIYSDWFQLNAWNDLTGVPGGFADGIDNTGILTEVDGSTTNELQTLSQNTTNGTLTISGSDDTEDLTELIQDQVGLMFSGNTEIGIAAVYDDPGNEIDLTVTGGSDDLDWVIPNTTTPPTSVTSSMAHSGKIRIGNTGTPTSMLDIQSSQNDIAKFENVNEGGQAEITLRGKRSTAAAVAKVNFENFDSNLGLGTTYSTARLISRSTSSSSSGGNLETYTTNTSGQSIKQFEIQGDGDVYMYDYPSTRNDAGTTTPVNYLYTGTDDKVRSAPVGTVPFKIINTSTYTATIQDYIIINDYPVASTLTLPVGSSYEGKTYIISWAHQTTGFTINANGSGPFTTYFYDPNLDNTNSMMVMCDGTGYYIISKSDAF